MRLWTLHPKYLDPVGLVALWREALLARAVLKGETVGYRHHPQLIRFRAQQHPVRTLDRYLHAVYAEALRRGYRFDRRKFGPVRPGGRIPERAGQLAFEWNHLLRKLHSRQPRLFEQLTELRRPAPHPLFRMLPGPVQPWERGAR